MLTIIIFLIIGIIFSYFFIDLYILSIVVVGICFGIGLIVAGALPSEERTVVRRTYYLQSIQDNSNTEGTFFLGCGSVDEEMKYTFYYKTNKGFKIKQIPCKEATIIHKEVNKKPRAELVINKRKDDNTIMDYFSIVIDRPNYNIYVPKGTIKNNYNLDAK